MRPNFFDFEPYGWRGAYPSKDKCSGYRLLVELLTALGALPRLCLKRIQERGGPTRAYDRMQHGVGVAPRDVIGECNRPLGRHVRSRRAL